MSTVTTNKTAEKFRKLADAMTAVIEEKRRPMTQAATHKRLGEYYSRLFDGDQLASAQRGLFALADAYDRGDVPAVLLSVKTKADVLDLMRLESERNSGYIKATDRYWLETPASVALQQLVAAAETPEDAADKADRERRQKIEAMTDKLRFAKIDGFFPTPRPIIDMMLKAADIQPTELVLEPSAGIGSIADAIRETVPGATVHCIERCPSLAAIITEKGHALIADDFMADDWFDSLSPNPARIGRYDKIVMNPPFENGQDGEHVQRAYGRLRVGGTLVAIVGAGLLYREDRKSQAFRQFANQAGCEYIPLPDGAFDTVDAFRRTGVKCALLVFKK